MSKHNGEEIFNHLGELVEGLIASLQLMIINVFPIAVGGRAWYDVPGTPSIPRNYREHDLGNRQEETSVMK